MAWERSDFFDGARTQAHELGITNREVRDAAELAEFIMSNRFESGVSREDVLAEFGFARVTSRVGSALGGLGEFFVKVIAKRTKRPREAAAFFVVTAAPHRRVRFIGFSSLASYRRSRIAMDDALGLLAHMARQERIA